MRILRLLKTIMDRALEVCALTTLVVMLVVVVIQVFSRFALPRTPPWTEEATRFLFITTVGFAAGLAVREKAFVNVDTLVETFPESLKRVLAVLMRLITIAFMLVIINYSIPFIRLGTRQASSSLLIPMSYPFSMTLIAPLFITIYTLIDLAVELVSAAKNPAPGGGE